MSNLCRSRAHGARRTGRRGASAAAVLRVVVLALPLLLPGSLRAQEPDERTVTVQATGEVEREPEQAVLRVAVETFAESADEAAERNAERVADVLDALDRLGIAEDQRRTVRYDVRPEYERRPDPSRGERDRRIVGYRVVNMLEVTIAEIDRVGDVIDAAIGAGANRIAGLSFGLADPAGVRHAALREAVRNARAEAAAIAEAAGRRLGPLLRASAAGARGGPPVRRLEAAQAMEVDARTPVEPGTLTVTATVTAVYALERP